MRLRLLLCCIALLWLAPCAAEACGATPPSFTLVTDDAGNVPAGTRVLKLYVYGSSIEPKPPTVNLLMYGGGLPVVMPVTPRVTAPWLVEIDLGGALVQSGVSYRLTVAGVESADASNSGYTANIPFNGVAASTLPSALGTLQLDGRSSGKHVAGVCGENAESEQALIKLVPSSAAEPWLRVLSHQLLLDGKPMFQPEIPLVDFVAMKNPLLIRALARCERSPSGTAGPFMRGVQLEVPSGKHSVKWSSTLANGTVLETPALEVDLTCAGSMPVVTPPCCKPLVSPADAGSATGTNPSMPAPSPPGNGSPPANPTDGSSTAAVDGGVSTASADGGVLSAAAYGGLGDDMPEDEGCSLASTTSGRATAWSLTLAFLMLRARRRRR